MIEIKERAEIRTKEIEFDFKKTQPENALTDFASSFDIFPLVVISKLNENISNTISPNLIVYLKLFNSKFIPEIEMLCYDDMGVLLEDLFPNDFDVIISIFIKSTSENTFPIRMDFVVTEFNPYKTSDTEKKFLLKGVLNVQELFFNDWEAWNKSTSFDVLKKIAKDTGLGFATNIENTNDAMTWINPADYYYVFIQNVTKRSYLNETSFFWSFIDFYYNLNFVNIEKELSENPNELQTLPSPFFSKDKNELLVDLYLSTDKNLSMTNKYIHKYNLNNQSTKTNIENGWKYYARWYDKAENIIKYQLVEENKTDDPNLIQLITPTEKIQEMCGDGDFLGKIDSDNVHKNYQIALILNQFNIEKMHKVTMTATLKLVNFEIKRFHKIAIDFIDISATKDDTGVREKLSGYWIVTGINYNFNRTDGPTQELTLVRRDLNLNYKEVHDIQKILNDNQKKK